MVHDYIRSELRSVVRVAPEHVEAIFAELEDRARYELAEEGMDPAAASLTREMDMRYTGQGYELRVPVPEDAIDVAALAVARTRFDKTHARIHGHAAEEMPVELVSCRVRARVAVPRYQPFAAGNVRELAVPDAASKGTRQVWFTSDAPVEAAIWARSQLPVGSYFAGPAIVEQLDATIVVPYGWRAQVDGYRNLILTQER